MNRIKISDCGDLQGNRLNICRGTYPDGTDIRMSEWKRQAYLVRWGYLPKTHLLAGAKKASNCPQLPEPYSDNDKEFILGTLCPECKHYHWPDKSCHCKCSKGTSVERLVNRGRCPIWKW